MKIPKPLIKWCTKDAEQGHAYAQTMLGYFYENGTNVTQDLMQAVKWFTKAAEQGFSEAQYRLGSMYKNGYGVAQDYKQAVK